MTKKTIRIKSKSQRNTSPLYNRLLTLKTHKAIKTY